MVFRSRLDNRYYASQGIHLILRPRPRRIAEETQVAGGVVEEMSRRPYTAVQGSGIGPRNQATQTVECKIGLTVVRQLGITCNPFADLHHIAHLIVDLDRLVKQPAILHNGSRPEPLEVVVGE